MILSERKEDKQQKIGSRLQEKTCQRVSKTSEGRIATHQNGIRLAVTKTTLERDMCQIRIP